jgi:hypothetical protein
MFGSMPKLSLQSFVAGLARNRFVQLIPDARHSMDHLTLSDFTQTLKSENPEQAVTRTKSMSVLEIPESTKDQDANKSTRSTASKCQTVVVAQHRFLRLVASATVRLL